MTRIAIASTLAVMFASIAVPAAAQDSVTATYDVRYLGIRIATARIDGGMENGRYRLTLESRYSVVVYSGTITSRVLGALAGDRLVPGNYTLEATGDPQRRSAIAFENGAAKTVTIVPPLEPDWNEGRVALQPQHMRNVLDPLSGFVLASMRAGANPEDACRTTVPVFSGVSRFDVALEPIPAAPVPANAGRAPRREGPDVISCRIRFVPIAGHRPVNQTVQALQAAESMRIDFERRLTGTVRLPHRIEIPTRFGTVSIRRTG